MLSLCEKAQYVVSGYIKIHEHRLFRENNDNSFHCIPYGIVDICISYYGHNDSFLKAGPLLKIHKSKDIVTAIVPGGINSVFGATGIDLAKINGMLYRWNIKILEFDEWFNIQIGLTTNTTHLTETFTKYIKGPKSQFRMAMNILDQFQAMHGRTPSLRSVMRMFSVGFPKAHEILNAYATKISSSNNEDICYTINDLYGDGFQEGDIIGLELNTKERTIEYYINDKSQGVVFEDVKRKEYYLGISFGGKDNCLQLIDFIESPISD